MQHVRDDGERAEADRVRGSKQTSVRDSEPLTFDVASLLSTRGEAILVHGGERYRLRITSRGKLILTK